MIDADNRAIPPIDLSRGTREQLYLAVRLGLIEEFAQRGTSLPLVLDEILVNFDPERMAAVAAGTSPASIRVSVNANTSTSVNRLPVPTTRPCRPSSPSSRRAASNCSRARPRYSCTSSM